MPSLKEQIQQDMQAALKLKQVDRRQALILIWSAIKQFEVDQRVTADDPAIIAILSKLAKQHQESIDQYQQAQRQDLVAKEQFELELVRQYLPEPMSEQQLQAIIQQAIEQSQATSARDMGKVMAMIKPQLEGRADMAQVSQLLKAHLLATK